MLSLILPISLVSCESSPILVGGADDWVPVAIDDDPFLPPAEATACTRWWVTGEDLVLDTAVCPWFTAQQPLWTDLQGGDRITSTVAWDPLTSSDGFTLTLALMIDDTVVWEHQHSLPAEAGALDIDVTLEAPAAVGAPMYLHVDGADAGKVRWGPVWKP
ncbi:MAG: hypothetical protein D6798_09240 [Deltaproteobacteria bacterium]|nr:MAG: hypothetical protein D6798_09240 [Deltaproteobacteria bacterium]